MHIAIAVNENNLKAIIPEKFEDAKGLMIVETDTMEVLDYIPGRAVRGEAPPVEDGSEARDWVEEMVRYECEALICGDMYDAHTFDAIAFAMISRYNGANYSARKATKKMLDYELEIIRDYVGGTGCGTHGDPANCAEHDHGFEE